MTPFRPETPTQAALRERASRQLLIVGLGTFILGFIAALFLCAWIIARFIAPEAAWWELLHVGWNIILVSFVAALGLTAGALWLLNQIHYRQGVYPCPYCGKPQRGFAITCDCPDAKSFRAPTEENPDEPSPGRFKPLYWVLFAYAALVPIAYLMATAAPGRKDWPLWAYVAVMHALLCALVAATCKLLLSILDYWTPKSRWFPTAGQAENFIVVLAVWPFCMAILMAIWKYKHG